MRVKESKVFFAICTTAVVLVTTYIYMRASLVHYKLLIFLVAAGILSHFLPFLLPFFISTSSHLRRPIKVISLSISALYSIGAGVTFFFWEQDKDWLPISLTSLYVSLSVGELGVYIAKVLARKRKRALLKKAPIKRRYGKEVKALPLAVCVETRQLRAKCDFSINGSIYIRKGETVELLHPIGSYYSVRNPSGAEYIVPKANFF
ncbi:hypothetical protein NEDG_00409 [Nematocida displodere]|uniref:Uncharacterized protein n=1 Tax=Nematocida displodere TaxID=1805483 RepID=A0A177EIY4_9MICR|nr:hypothetical protein NEDG_00409 [Nematocida displodere]